MKKIFLALVALIGWGHAFTSTASFSKNLSAVDSAITIDSRGYNSVSFQLTGTWSATVKFEGTVNGTTWTTVFAVNQKGGAVDSVATANGVYLLSGNGFSSIRARVSARSSGTIAVQSRTNEGSGVVSLLNQSSAGASSNVAVTSSALPTGAATAANQTSGGQKTQIVDGSNNVIGATSNALDVNIKSGASSGAVAQGSTTSGQTGGLTQAAVTTAAPTYTTGQTSPLSLTTSGALRVDASAQTLTVGSHNVTNAGTFATQAAQSGTWTVQPGNTANTTAWLVTGTGGTFPVTAASLPLPTGAATAAKQPALGTAGTPSTDVISVQGVASGTAMPISAAALPLPALAATSTKQSDGTQKTQIVDGSGNVIASTSNNLNVQCANCSGSGVSAADEASFTAGASTFALGGGTYQVTQTANPLTTGQQGAFQSTRFRALHVNLRDSTGAVLGNATTPLQVSLANTGANATAVKVDNSAVTQPVSGTVTANAGTGTFTVSGTVTANAGTNLNTSALALDATLGRAQGSTTSGQTGPLIQGAVTTGAPSYTTAQTSPFSLTTAGALRVDPSGVTSPVSGTVTANAGTGTFATNVSQINGVTPLMGNGVTGTGSQRVTIASDNTAFSVNATATGPAAHDAAISGNPVRVAGRARTSDYTAVANDDVADAQMTIEGKLVTQPIAIRASTWNYAAAAGGLVTTSGVTAKTAAGAGIRNCVDAVQVMNSHQTIGTEVMIRDGAAGTVLWRGWAQFTGGGSAHQFSPPLCGTANTLIEIAEVTATGTAGVLVNLQGHVTQE